MRSLDSFAEAKLEALGAQRLRRSLAPTHRLDGLWVERAGRRLLSFSCNDYLNLSQDARVKAAAREAIDIYGAGAGASRLVTGDHPLISALEAKLARFKGTEAACVFGSGYLTNAGVIPALVGAGDVIFADELSHACIWAGAKLSGATTLMFRHNDLMHLEELLTEHRGRHGHAVVATEGVFSMDGDLAPLERLTQISEAHDAWLLVDDAHGLGVVGEGRGATHTAPAARVPLQIGTLSKSAGAYGGYLCASRPVIELMISRARTLVYSTGLPPAAAAAALAALEIIETDGELCARPLAKARRFTAALNLPRAESAVVPLVVGEAARALEASERLAAQGFLVVAIRPPTVPEGTARLRFAFTAAHPDAEIDRLVAAVRALDLA